MSPTVTPVQGAEPWHLVAPSPPRATVASGMSAPTLRFVRMLASDGCGVCFGVQSSVACLAASQLRERRSSISNVRQRTGECAPLLHSLIVDDESRTGPLATAPPFLTHVSPKRVRLRSLLAVTSKRPEAKPRAKSNWNGRCLQKSNLPSCRNTKKIKFYEILVHKTKYRTRNSNPVRETSSTAEAFPSQRYQAVAAAAAAAGSSSGSEPTRDESPLFDLSLPQHRCHGPASPPLDSSLYTSKVVHIACFCFRTTLFRTLTGDWRAVYAAAALYDRTVHCCCCCS